MDFYCYFKERFGWGSNPYASVEKCRHIVDALLSNPAIPSRISVEAAVGFLTAARDFAGDGCFLSSEFASVLASLTGELHAMMEEVMALDSSWAPDDGQDGPVYNPDEYEVWPRDEEWSDPADEEGVEEESDDVYEQFKSTLDQLYGSDGEVGITGTRRPFEEVEQAFCKVCALTLK